MRRLQYKKMDAQAESPLSLDIKDLERDIVLLEQTNKQLKDILADDGSLHNEATELRLVIVENEFAIEAKLKRRRELHTLLGISTANDSFESERTITSTQSMDQKKMEEPRAVLLGIDDDSNGVML